MEKRNVIVAPLNDTNYPTWKVQMKLYLISQDLFGVVDGSDPEPSTSNDAELRKYHSRRSKAVAAIGLAIEPKLLYLIGDPSDPAVVWKKLSDTFQRKTWSNKLRLRRKLYGMKLKEGVKMQEHLKSFVEIYDELSILGEAVKEEDRVINLLASLPDSFSTLVTALEALDQVPSWDVVTEKLLHEEGKLAEKAVHDNGNSSVFMIRRKGKKDVKCYECGKYGHIRAKCSVYIDKLKNNPKNVAKCAETNEIPTVTFVASAFSNFSGSNCWIIDSGASEHMCRTKNSFALT